MSLKLVIGSLALAALLAPACSSGGTATSLTLYSGQHPATTQAMVSSFTKATGIKVTVRAGDETELSRQIVQEGAGSPADVFYSENSPALFNLDEKRLLSPVDAATLAATTASYVPSDKGWAPVSARVMGVVYNTAAMTPAQLPKSVLDLQGAAWKGRIGIAPDDTDFHPLVSSVAQAEQQQVAVIWLQALKANAGDKTYPTNEALLTAVDQGAVPLGVVNTYDWYRFRHDHPAVHSAVELLPPRDTGYLLDVSGAAVLRTSPHQAAAQKLVAFLAGPRGGEVMARSAIFEYPLARGVAADPQLPPLASLQPTKVTPDDLGDGSLPRKLLARANLP